MRENEKRERRRGREKSRFFIFPELFAPSSSSPAACMRARVCALPRGERGVCHQCYIFGEKGENPSFKKKKNVLEVGCRERDREQVFEKPSLVSQTRIGFFSLALFSRSLLSHARDRAERRDTRSKQRVHAFAHSLTNFIVVTAASPKGRRPSAMGSSAFAVLATIAAGLLSLSLSPASVLVGATYTAKELRGEEKVEVQAIQDIFNYQLGPTREELKSASVQTSDFLPDLPAYGLAGPCGVSPNIIKTKITVKCPYFDELKMLGWKNATLKVTMMLPGHAANGRAAPWPVIYIYAGFSVSSRFFSCAPARRGMDPGNRLRSASEGVEKLSRRGRKRGAKFFFSISQTVSLDSEFFFRVAGQNLPFTFIFFFLGLD